jgi:AmiR/NasT family two-component response regulator
MLREEALMGRDEIYPQHEPDQQGLLGLVENLELAVEHRTTIGVALGIVMERLGVDQEHAFSYLKRVSQDTNTKVYDLAGAIAETRKLPALLPRSPAGDVG